MYDLTDANMDGLEDISENEMIEMQKHAQSIANILEVALTSKQIPAGSIYWRAAKILSTVDNYLNKYDDENAVFLRETHGVLVDTVLLDDLQKLAGDELNFVGHE